MLIVAILGLGIGAAPVVAQVFDQRVQEALRAPAPEVLIINSYAPGYQWSDDMFAGAVAVLRERYKDIEPVVQYLDARRFPESERDAWLLADIRHKVTQRPPRIVITLDNAAFDFALRHRADIAPGVPLVFGGLNRFLPEMIAGQAAITGVSEETDFSGTLQLIEHLRPNARQVLVVSNPSPSAVESRRAFERFVPRYAGRYRFEHFDTWTNDELFRRLASLDPSWVVLVLDATRDAAGENNYNNTRFYDRMRQEPAVPVFVTSRPPGRRDVAVEPWDTIGGGVVVAEDHGRTVGRLALRVLEGEPAEAIPVVQYSPQQLQVEYTQLRRFGIPLSALPEGTIVNNEPVDTVAVDRARILQVATVMVVLCGVIVVLSLNILWRRRAERALRRAEEQLLASQKLEAVGQLAGGVAHDFNNILQVIRGHATFLRESLQTTRSGDIEDVTMIQAATERAAQLTRQLLAFGRKQALSFEPVDANALVVDMVKMLSRVLGEHIELVCEPASVPCTMSADRGQLEQVLLNLCLNARDAMPSGGRLRLRVTRVELGDADLAKFPELKPGPHVRLEVADTGTGMSLEVQRRIFEPFFTTKATGKGTGLGLAVVYGVVSQHAGAIRVESAEGAGAEFCILIPATTAGEPRASEPAPVEHIPRGRGTVLLAEDDPRVRAIAARVLGENGFRVIAAADGQEAIALFERHRHDDDLVIAVLDVLMPKRSGRDVYTHLRAALPGLPVLFCSGYSTDVLPAHAVPGDEFVLLKKPYTTHQLLSHVHQLLERRRSARAG